MKILVLSPYPDELIPALSQFPGDELLLSNELPGHWPHANIVVCYGYRHYIGAPTRKNYEQIINIHISALPWNRGADPNLWSWYDDTPKGVSIHDISDGLDEGDVYGTCQIGFQPGHTLRTSYNVLRRTAVLYFLHMWPKIHDQRIRSFPQQGFGSSHKLQDKEKIISRLPLLWDTPVTEVETLGRTARGQTIRDIS